MALFYFRANMGQRPLDARSCLLWFHKSRSFWETPLCARERMRMEEAREFLVIMKIIAGHVQGSLGPPRVPRPLCENQWCSDGSQTVGNFGQVIQSLRASIFLPVKIWGVITVVIRL